MLSICGLLSGESYGIDGNHDDEQPCFVDEHYISKRAQCPSSHPLITQVTRTMLLVKFLALAAVAVAADCSSSPSPSSTSPPKPHATGALHPNNNDKAWCVSSSGTGINTGVLEGPVTL